MSKLKATMCCRYGQTDHAPKTQQVRSVANIVCFAILERRMGQDLLERLDEARNKGLPRAASLQRDCLPPTVPVVPQAQHQETTANSRASVKIT